MTIGEKIYKLRKDLALSQEEFAFRIGVSKQTVFNWENGLICPKLARLETISKEFNIDINYFIKDDCEEIKEDENIQLNKSNKSINKKYLLGLLSLCFLFVAFLGVIIVLGFSLFSGNKGLTHIVIIDSDILLWVGFIFIIAILFLILLSIIYFTKKFIGRKNEKKN